MSLGAAREVIVIVMQQSRNAGRYGSSCVLAALCAAFLFAGWPHFSPRTPTSPELAAQAKISVATEVVLLPVRVTDASGKVVSGLTRENFSVYDNGRPQKITFFQQADTPVTVGLLVDHSGSMAPKLRQVAAALYVFAHSSNPSDEMFVVNFSDGVALQPLDGQPFTNDARVLERAVTAVSASGQTALYDAVIEGLHHLQLGTLDKKALLIVSDGGDNASRHKYAEVLQLAQQSQPVIYSIGLVGGTLEEENPGVLRRLAKDTGGLAFFPDSVESVVEISRAIAADLREQYTIGYAPERKGDASFRKVSVKVTRPGREKLRVRTRPGYTPAQPAAVAPGNKT